MGNPVPPMTPAGKAVFDTYKPSSGPRAVVPALGNDPMGRCDPWVIPGICTSTAGLLNLFKRRGKYSSHSTGLTTIVKSGRTISLFPKMPDPRWYGWAVGKWEGDTFVITSKGYNSKNWLDNVGHPQSESMTLEERWTRTDFETLQLTMTLKDPEYYTAPWVSAKPQIFKLQLPVDRSIIGEEFCVPSEEEAFNQNVRNLAGTGKKIVEPAK